MNIRCGSRLYKGIEIPESVMIHIKAGREFYFNSSDSLGFSEIRYIDTGEKETISSQLLATYIKAEHDRNKSAWEAINTLIRKEQAVQQKIEQIKLKV